MQLQAALEDAEIEGFDDPVEMTVDAPKAQPTVQ
jgi:hypothetical protein